jgi:hypothetical protein
MSEILFASLLWASICAGFRVRTTTTARMAMMAMMMRSSMRVKPFFAGGMEGENEMKIGGIMGRNVIACSSSVYNNRRQSILRQYGELPLAAIPPAY